jgi:hypothetical protein
MKVALFKLTKYADNHSPAQPFEEGQCGKDWTQVSDWVEVEFNMIDVDFEEARRADKQREIDTLQKKIDALKEEIV